MIFLKLHTMYRPQVSVFAHRVKSIRKQKGNVNGPRKPIRTRTIKCTDEMHTSTARTLPTRDRWADVQGQMGRYTRTDGPIYKDKWADIQGQMERCARHISEKQAKGDDLQTTSPKTSQSQQLYHKAHQCHKGSSMPGLSWRFKTHTTSHLRRR